MVGSFRSAYFCTQVLKDSQYLSFTILWNFVLCFICIYCACGGKKRRPFGRKKRSLRVTGLGHSEPLSCHSRNLLSGIQINFCFDRYYKRRSSFGRLERRSLRKTGVDASICHEIDTLRGTGKFKDSLVAK